MSTTEHTKSIVENASAWAAYPARERRQEPVYAHEYRGDISDSQGMQPLKDGCNFYIKTAEDIHTIDLVSFDSENLSPKTEWRLKSHDHQQKTTHSGFIPQLQPGDLYALRINQEELILDPYARGIIKSPLGSEAPLDHLSSVVDHQDFDWEDVKRPIIPDEERVIYEAHIKSSTMRHPDIPEELKGTYLGFAHPSHLDHLKNLGITTVEIQPTQQFFTNQWVVDNGMTNYWGYGTGNFFAPHAEYAHGKDPGDPVEEFKTMVKQLHKAGFEVIMDVVYNHTGEDNPLQRLDNNGYYRINSDGNYIDYTGCGNTIDSSKPTGQKLILDSLRMWAEEMQVDGFRFDLAPALARNEIGWWQIEDHPLLAAINQDPILKDRLMIAEPWDIYGYPQPEGQFGKIGWREWDGRFRDLVRDTWSTRARRNLGHAASLLVDNPSAEKSINFVTAHDGFTGRDLVSYNDKHNLANGENNRDGTNDNRSNNHGHEGETDDYELNQRRLQTARNLSLTALMAQGTPMILAGDEVYHTKNGNNNTWNQDNHLSHINWPAATEPGSKEQQMLEFMSEVIAIRQSSRLTGSDRIFEQIPNSPIDEMGLKWLDANGQEIPEGDYRWDRPGVLGMYASGGHFADSPSDKKSIIYYANTGDEDVTVNLPTDRATHGDYALLASTKTGEASVEGIERLGDSFVLPANSSVVLERLSTPLPTLTEQTIYSSEDRLLISDLTAAASISLSRSAR